MAYIHFRIEEGGMAGCIAVTWSTRPRIIQIPISGPMRETIVVLWAWDNARNLQQSVFVGWCLYGSHVVRYLNRWFWRC